MRTSTPEQRRESLLLTLCALFVGFFVTAELLGAKLWDFTLFGVGPRDLGLGEGTRFVATTGIFAFPLTFLLTDILNEYFGRRIVRVFTWLAIAVNVILQPVVQAAIRAPAVSFTAGLEASEIDLSYRIALGQTWAIVAASLIAFSIGQLTDAYVFTWLRRRTGGRLLWLRSQGSTVVSQLIDTFVVIFLAFVVIPELFGQPHMPVSTATTISMTNYVYKFAIAVGITPLLYLVHAAVERWLGRELAEELVHRAHPRDPE
jgi:queuosine precursor transporter